MSVSLADIINEIKDWNTYHWAILYLNATGNLEKGQSMSSFMQKINKTSNGLPIKWEDLISLSEKLYDIIDVLIIGCKDPNLLHRYETDQEIHEMCDIVIEKIDSSYWEFFSKNEPLIDKLSGKFKQIMVLS